MKKYIKLLLCVFLALITVSACSDEEKAKPEESSKEDALIPEVENDLDKFIYTKDGDSVILMGYSGVESTITIPEELEGLPVTVIAENAFSGFVQLESLIIPDSVEIIDYAFNSCEDLKYVSIGDGVISMNDAFRDCPSLEKAVGGSSVQYMDGAFANCVSLTEGIIPSTAKSALSAFSGCKALKTAEIADGIAYLDRTFEGCSSLSSISIPKSVSYLVSAFTDCASLSEVIGGEGVSVYNEAFIDCVNLVSITLGDEINELVSAFCGCVSLKKVENLPKSVEKYSASFTGCRAIDSITVPQITDPESLDDYSPSVDFSGCESVKSIELLADFTVREEFCKLFSGLMSLESLKLTENTMKGLLKVSYSFSDALFEGKDKKVTAAVKKCKNSTKPRITKDYAVIDGKSYTHIYGGEVYAFDPDEKAAEVSVTSFEELELSYYWCGYPDGGSYKKNTVAVKRTYSFFLSTTGKNNGTLPKTLDINGFTCAVGE